jgi:hypothetical protein
MRYNDMPRFTVEERRLGLSVLLRLVVEENGNILTDGGDVTLAMEAVKKAVEIAEWQRTHLGAEGD